jgi:hypothetical protein
MNRLPTVVTVILNWYKRDILVKGGRAKVGMDYSSNRVIVVENAFTNGSREVVFESRSHIFRLHNVW